MRHWLLIYLIAQHFFAVWNPRQKEVEAPSEKLRNKPKMIVPHI
jgi:hypothetical protein